MIKGTLEIALLRYSFVALPAVLAGLICSPYVKFFLRKNAYNFFMKSLLIKILPKDSEKMQPANPVRADSFHVDDRKLNTGGIIFLIISIYFMYYLLLRDNKFPFSINAVSTGISHYFKHWRVMTAGLLPVYIGLMIFGAAVCGIYLGSAFHCWIIRKFKQNHRLKENR